MLLLGLLLWGTWNQRGWGWWGSILYYATLAATWLVTSARTPYRELLAWLQFGARETQMLSGIPLRGWEIGLFAGLPMLACLGVVLASRRHWGRQPA